MSYILSILFNEEGEELPDSFVTIPYYLGTTTTVEPSGGISVGVNDGNPVKIITHTATISEGFASSMHTEDNTTSYQNTSGADAFVIFVLECNGAGAEERHIRIYDSPTDNTATGNLRFEIGSGTTSNKMDAANEKMSVGPFKISDDNYCVIQNVDDSRPGVNDISAGIAGWAIERITPT